VVRPAKDPFEGGIGGTGIVGGLVGFGSLVVNGLRLDTNVSTRYRTAFGRTDLGFLQAGMPLTIYADRRSDRLIARDVAVDYTLIGTVRRSATGVTVNSVPVQVERGARGRLANGDRVAIGGVWTAKGVRASLIVPAPSVPDLISGTVTTTENGTFAIGRAAVSYAGGRPSPGSYAVAIGRAGDGPFQATEVLNPRFSNAPNLQQLSVEGYLEPISTAPGFRVAGLGHSFADNVMLASIGTQRALYFGRYDGKFNAANGYIVSDDASRRVQQLRRTDFDSTDLTRISLTG
jgi:hypothetical protein